MDRLYAISAEEKSLISESDNMGSRQRKVGVSTFFTNPKAMAEVIAENAKQQSHDADPCKDCAGDVRMIEETPPERCLDGCPLKSEAFLNSSEVSIHRSPIKLHEHIEGGWNPYSTNKGEAASGKVQEPPSFLSFCKNGFDCHRCSKPEILSWIGQHVSQVYNNTRMVREKINAVFNQLIHTCEQRRNQLLDQVTDIEGKKIESLKRVHDACMSSERMDSQFIEDFCSLDFVGAFKLEDGFTGLKTFGVSNHKMPGFSSSNNMSNDGHVQTENSESQMKSDLTSFKLPTVEEGNLVFQEEQSLSAKIMAFGKLNETLASPDYTTVSGLGLMYGFVNEETEFKVSSRSKTGETAILTSEILKVRITGPDESEVESFVNGHSVSFTPVLAGLHAIHVMINGVEIPGSPASCRVLQKEKLVFDYAVSSREAKGDGSAGMEDGTVNSGSKRGIGDSHEEIEPGSELARGEQFRSIEDWTLQRGETSALLSRTGSGGALLYAAPAFDSGTHAWRVKVTSACLSVKVSIGVSTRTDNYDLDTDSACQFNLKCPPLPRAPQTFFNPQRRRKVSIFERYTFSFIVIADLAFRELKVINSSTLEMQLKTIPVSYSVVYPTIFMEHDCKKSVCPRPQVTFA